MITYISSLQLYDTYSNLLLQSMIWQL